jgi:lipopolysaccharide/colanic/teichoic acid biosynthesis glycosyltransferase
MVTFGWTGQRVPLQLTRSQQILKRTLDLTITVPFVLMALPLLVCIAVAIYLDSGGPIMYRQPRVGEGGKVFHMFKFRTMIRQAERRVAQVPISFPDRRQAFKVHDDPRVTRIGHLLRRSSLDEIPQILNVLLGHMSLVGPRPEVLQLAESYAAWQWQRFGVPSGITGLWQIRGRSNRPLEVKCQDDLEYISQYSIWLDIQILFRTIVPVIRGTGAF